MVLKLQRLPPIDDGTPGDLWVDGLHECHTLERLSRQIPVGIYDVTMTVSARATAGHLWSPYVDHTLPLIGVRGRSGIRIHAANQPDELEGCIAVGQVRSEDHLWKSRVALTLFLEKLRAALKTEPATLTVLGPL